MIYRFFKRRRIGRASPFVEPDEVFLDDRNLPVFDKQQFEGRIEKTIGKKAIWLVFGFASLLFIFFTIRLGVLQIKQGKELQELSLINALEKQPVFAERGIIFDRNNVPLAWNDKPDTTEDAMFYKRVYIASGGFGNLLGYVQYPKKDSSGNYWRTEFTATDGIEEAFNEDLQGENGEWIFEEDVQGNIVSSNVINPPLHGKNISLSIDKDLQENMYKEIVKMATEVGYQGGAGIVMDVKTGELLTMTTFPQYDPNVLSLGTDTKTISGYNTSSRKPFLNRAIAGLYSPGSIIKPFVGLSALIEGVVTETTQILSDSYISIPNPYDSTKKTLFRDLHPNNGWVDIKKALAVSSNIYFYEVGGGYQGQKGIGIEKLKNRIKEFGIAQKTGIEIAGEKDGTIPDPKWKEENFPDDPWRIGDTYNTSIGQYGFQVTPIEMVRAVASIANKGTVLRPTIIKKSGKDKGEVQATLPHKTEHFDAIHEGMRMAVTESYGTVQRLNILSFDVAAKTGTAQVGANNEYINSWIIGFWPYENPRYAFAILLERGPGSINVGASSVAQGFLLWLEKNKPEYIQ